MLSSKLYYGFTECNSSYYTKHQELVENYILTAKKENRTIYCINHSSQADFKLAYPFLANNSTNIKILINQCTNAQKQSSYPYFSNKDDYDIDKLANCLDDDTLAYYYQKIILRIDFIDSFYNFKELHNPAVSEFNSLTKQITKGDLFMSTMLELGIKELLSDESWIFENYIDNKIIYYRNSYNEYLQPTLFSKELFTLSIEVSKKIIVSTRSYMKLQDLFARIGGFYNALSILINIILYDYVRFKFNSNYSKYTLDISNFKLQEKDNDFLNPKIDNIYDNQNDNSFEERSIRKKIEHKKSLNNNYSVSMNKSNNYQENDNIVNNIINKDIKLNDISNQPGFNHPIKIENLENKSKNLVHIKSKTKTDKDKVFNENNCSEAKVFNVNHRNNTNDEIAELQKLQINNFIRPNNDDNNDNLNKIDFKKPSFTGNSLEPYISRTKKDNNSQFPVDIVYFDNINFIEDDATDMKRKKLLKRIEDLNYYDYIKGRFHLNICCTSKANLGTRLLKNPKTLENYSIVNYFKKIKNLSTFEKNISELKSKVYGLKD